MERKFEMYDTLKDGVTGYEGVVLAITEHSTGCIHYGLQCKKLDKDGAVRDYEWFDETRLKRVRKAPKKKGVKAGGPTQECPAR